MSSCARRLALIATGLNEVGTRASQLTRAVEGINDQAILLQLSNRLTHGLGAFGRYQHTLEQLMRRCENGGDDRLDNDIDYLAMVVSQELPMGLMDLEGDILAASNTLVLFNPGMESRSPRSSSRRRRSSSSASRRHRHECAEIADRLMLTWNQLDREIDRNAIPAATETLRRSGRIGTANIIFGQFMNAFDRLYRIRPNPLYMFENGETIAHCREIERETMSEMEDIRAEMRRITDILNRIGDEPGIATFPYVGPGAPVSPSLSREGSREFLPFGAPQPFYPGAAFTPPRSRVGSAGSLD